MPTAVKYYCIACPCCIIRGDLASETRSPIPALAEQTDFYVVSDKFDFDNIGQSRPHQHQVYISCADCDKVLGYLDAEKYYLAKNLVRTTLS